MGPETGAEAGPGRGGEVDGRRAKGARRRRALLDATVRLVGAVGIDGLTQRAVAAEAGVPPSAVLYYYASVDELVAAALRDCNDHHLANLAAATRAEHPLEALAVFLAGCADRDKVRTAAETELWLLAARRPELRGELARWEHGLSDLAAALAPDEVTARALALVVDGIYVAVATDAAPSREEIAAVLARVVGP